MPDTAQTLTNEAVVSGLPRRARHCVDRLPVSAPLPVAWVLLVAASADAIEIGTAARSGISEALHSAFGACVARREAARCVDRSSDADDASRTDHAVGLPDTSAVDSAFGGLFYLLSLVLELSIGEILWRACLPEGSVLARAIGALAGECEEDPALWTFGGVRRGEAWASVSEEQQAEATVALCATLVEALPRRGLAVLPEPIVRLIDLADGRLLVASGRGSPYIFFAAPARTPAETVSALESFLSQWPLPAPVPRAERALASLARRARIAPVMQPEPPCDLLRIEVGSLFASALLTQIAGTLGHLFAARVGLAQDASQFDVVRHRLAVPARLVTTPSTLTIQISMERLDPAVRRAGLDADPGWVPWLERRVAFEFLEDAAGHDVRREP